MEIPEVYKRGKGVQRKRLALDNEGDVGQPHSDGEPNDVFVFVPNCDAEDLNEPCVWQERVGLKRWNKAYIRKTIKIDAALRPT
jgi:hypothetical protein